MQLASASGTTHKDSDGNNSKAQIEMGDRNTNNNYELL